MSDVTENQHLKPIDTPVPAVAPPRVRQFGAVNWRGLWTLYHREVKRFFKVFTQTLAAPVVTTLLFYTIFTVALQSRVGTVGTVSFRIQCAKVALLECFALSRYRFKTTRFRTIETRLVRRHVGVTFTLNSGR